MLFSLFKNKKTPSGIFLIQHHDSFASIHDKFSHPIDLSVSDQSDSQKNSLHATISRKRLSRGFCLFFCLFGLLFSRSIYLQIIKGSYFHALADANRYRQIQIISPRGEILDRNGFILAKNIPSFVLSMTIVDLPTDRSKRNDEFDFISKTIGVPRTDLDLLLTEYSSQPYEHIPVLTNIPYESAIRLDLLLSDIPGFSLKTSTQRYYNSSSVVSLSHVLGYVGKMNKEEYDRLGSFGYRLLNQIGKTGVEKFAESILRGQPGKSVVEVDASGHELSVVSKTEAIKGGNVILGIDLAFQKYAEIRLQDTLNAIGAKKGTIIAMDPNTGIVRALVSLPAFNNNIFSAPVSQDVYNKLVQDPDQPMFFRAISGEYPSGSIFKPFVAYAALAERVVSDHTSFLSTGGLKVGDWFFPDWKVGGHGVTDIRKAISESVNTFFYIIGGGFENVTGLGVDRIVRYARMFGFGSKTEIDIPGESDGFLPSKEWKEQTKKERWYVGDTYHLAIGQGDFLTTPIQMAVATSIIANNGFIIQPHVIQSIEGVESVDSSKKELKHLENFDADALRVIKEGMRQSVISGSSRRLSSLSVEAAGKTGTAQSGENRPTHSWFTGFAPYDSPSLVITVLVEEGGESTDAAVPIAYDLIAWWFQHEQNK